MQADAGFHEFNQAGRRARIKLPAWEGLGVGFPLIVLIKQRNPPFAHSKRGKPTPTPPKRGIGRRANAFDDGINFVAVAQRVGMAFQDDRDRAFRRHRAVRMLGLRREQRPKIAVHVHRADNRLIDGFGLQKAHGGIQRLQAGIFFAGNRDARAADLEFAGDAAGDDPAERADGAVGGQRRAKGVAQRDNPRLQFFVRQVQT